MSISIGFARLPRSGLIELRATYGDRQGPYLLDSGSHLDVLNRAVHPFELGEEQELQVLEVDGEPVEALTLAAAPFRLGQYTHAPAEALAVPLSYTGSTGEPIHGFLGHPLFQETPIGIRWASQVVVLGPPTHDFLPLAEVPLTVSPTDATLPVTLGKQTYQLRLETAGAFAILIEDPEFPSDRYLDPGAVQGGATSRLLFPLVTFGGLPLAGVEGIADPGKPGGCAGRLGVGLLSRWDLWIDYPGERLLLGKRGG